MYNLRGTQKENFDIEDEALNRLGGLKNLNQQLASTQKHQQQTSDTLKKNLSRIETEHERLL